MTYIRKFEWLFKYDQKNIDDDEIKPFKFDKSYTYSENTIVNI